MGTASLYLVGQRDGRHPVLTGISSGRGLVGLDPALCSLTETQVVGVRVQLDLGHHAGVQESVVGVRKATRLVSQLWCGRKTAQLLPPQVLGRKAMNLESGHHSCASVWPLGPEKLSR